MRKLALWLIFHFLALAPAMAQVTVEVLQEQGHFLPGEDINLAVRVVNNSGQTLRFGDDPGWLTFTLESSEGAVVSQTGDVPVVGGFDLESSKMATKRVNLAPFYSFPGPGRYLVRAIVKVKAWDREISSPPKGFSIIQGAKLWQQDFGVPGTATNGAPEIRKYTLQQATYLRGALRLYLRVTDVDGGRTFKVVPIGPMVSFGRPQPQVDQHSNLHLIYQNGPQTYGYTVHDPNGELLKRQTYEISETRPRLRADDQGRIIVAGGLRRESSTDFPPPKPEEEEKSAEAHSDSGTNSAGQVSAQATPGTTNQVEKAEDGK
jgi:hypothetical protein